MHAPKASTFRTNDPEQAHALLAASYTAGRGVRLSGSVENFEFENDRRELGEIRFDTMRNTLDSEYTMQPLGCVVIMRVVDGVVDIATNHSERRMTRGDTFLFAHPEQDYISRQFAPGMQVIGVDLSLLGQVTDEPAMDVVDRFRTDALPAEAARRWQRTVDYLTTTVLGEDETSAHPLVLSHAGRLLAATLITEFDPAAATEHTRDRIDATPEVIRRAIAYMETNQDLDVSVADVARAGRVGVRALQLAFRRHLDTTPLAYLRKVRLDQVRAHLVAADPGTGATVIAIAARWGFHSSSRFAEHYRAAYGELPSHTLHHRY